MSPSAKMVHFPNPDNTINSNPVGSPQDIKFKVIAPIYIIPPTNGGTSICDKCSSYHRCKLFSPLHIPLDCEKVSANDLLALSRVGTPRLWKIGWMARTLSWTEDDWGRFEHYRMQYLNRVIYPETEEGFYD